MLRRTFSHRNGYSTRYLFAGAATASLVTSGFAYHYFSENKTYTTSPALFDYAANGDESDLRQLLRTHGKRAFEYDASAVTCCGGNTALHLAAERNSLPVIEIIVTSSGEKAQEATKVTNNKGKIPIQCIRENPRTKYNPGQHAQFFSVLRSPTLSHKESSITEPLDKSMITRMYPDIDKNSKQYENLCLGYEAANETRRLLQESFTHPSANTYSRDRLNRLSHSIAQMRHHIPDLMVAGKTYSSDEMRQLNHQKHQLRVQAAIKNKGGNCGEYSHVAAECVANRNVDKVISIYIIKNGDHEFTVIADSEPVELPYDVFFAEHKNPEVFFGKNAVICDAWSGKVYLAKDMLSQLRDYTHLRIPNETNVTHPRNIGNVCPTFNPKYHRLSRVFLNDSSLRPLPIVSNADTQEEPNFRSLRLR
jgi:hypothetical protein